MSSSSWPGIANIRICSPGLEIPLACRRQRSRIGSIDLIDLGAGRLATSAAKPLSMRRVAHEALVQRLTGMAVGTRLPPLQALARELGIGRISVLEAMRDLAGEGVVVARPRLGTFVARSPAGHAAPVGAALFDRRGNPASQPLAGKRIALVGEAQGEGMVEAMMRAAEQTLRAAGGHPFKRPHVDADPLTPFDLGIVFNPLRVRGMLISCPAPVVVASTSWHESFMPEGRYDMVGVDQQGGARLAGARLAQSRFKSACFIGVRRPRRSESWDEVSQLRLKGLEEGFGRAIPAEFRLNCEGYSLVAGGRGFRRYMELPRRPVAVFAASDEIAMGFLASAEAHDMKPLRDFSLIGFDGQSIGRQPPGPELTSVAVPAAAMGQTAGELAMQRLLQPDRPRQVTYLSCELYRGGTVARAL